MKVFRILLAATALVVFAIIAHTQTRPGPGPTNVAIIDSSSFSDERNGIARVMAAMREIEAKFTPLRAELRNMRDRLATMRTDIQQKQAVQDAKITARQIEQADQLELQIKRKAEDAQSNYQRESLAKLEPLQKEIATALTAYAQSKGITLLIDVNRVPVVYAAQNLDVTKDFIADYNRTHPVAPAPARTTRP